MKGVGCLRQHDGGHGSRNLLRSVFLKTHMTKQQALKMDGTKAPYKLENQFESEKIKMNSSF